MRNQFKSHIEVTRIEICDLVLACTLLDQRTDDSTTKWRKLHDKLKAQLDELDRQLDEVQDI